MCGDTSGLTLALRATRWRGLTPLTQKVSCDSQKVSGDAWLGGAAPYISGYLCGINCSQQEKFFASGLTYGLVRTSMGTEPLIDQKRSAVMRGWGGGAAPYIYVASNAHNRKSSSAQAAADFDPTSHADFGAATHPGVGGGTHRRRATFKRR